MPGRLIVVESNTTGTGMELLRAATRLGLAPVLLTAWPGRYAGLAATGAEVSTCDTDTPTTLRAAATGLGAVAGVTTTSEFYLEAVATLAAGLGLPGDPPTVSRACRDKSRTRAVLAAAGVPQPRFAVVRDPARARAAVAAVGLPCVVKPVDDSGSLNVRVCDGTAEVERHIARVTAVRTNVRGQPTAGAALVEEYLAGEEFSVEMFGHSGGISCAGITATALTDPPYAVESGHLYPAPVDPRAATAVVGTVRRALRALGVRHGPSHTEVKLLPHGRVAIIEVNARLAGGMIPELVRLATGVDLVEQQVRAAVGWPVAVGTRPRGHAGIRFLAAAGTGVLRGVHGVEDARSVPGVTEVRVAKQPGAEVCPPRSSYDRLGHVIAHGPSPQAVTGSLEAAGRAIHLDIAEPSGGLRDRAA